MVGQAAKGLGAHHVAVAALHQLHGLRCEQPALAHFAAVADDLARQGFQVGIGGRGCKLGELLHCGDQIGFILGKVPLEQGAHLLFRLAAPIELDVLQPVVHLEDHKGQNAGDHHLAVLPEQEVLQVVVGQGGVFHIDLPYHAHFDFFHIPPGDIGKGLGDLLEVLPHLPLGEGLALFKKLGQLLGPGVHQGVAGAGGDLVGLSLVFQQHQQVPVGQGGNGLADHGQGDLKAGVGLQAGQVQRDHWDKVQPILFQGFPQQVDVVGGPAPAAGLGHDQGHLVQVVLAAVQGVHQLADGQQRRVAGVVVHVFEAFIHNLPAGGAQQVHMVAEAFQHVFDQLKVDGRHVGGDDGVLFFHLPGEFHPVLVVRHEVYISFLRLPRRGVE